MKLTIPDLIKNHWLEKEIEPNRCCSISLKSIRKTMKWEILNFIKNRQLDNEIEGKTQKPDPSNFIEKHQLENEMVKSGRYITVQVGRSISLKSIRKTMQWGRLVPHGMCMLVSRGTPHFIENHKENHEMEALDPAIRILIGHSISLKPLATEGNGDHSKSLKTISYRMKLASLGVAQFHSRRISQFH